MGTYIRASHSNGTYNKSRMKLIWRSGVENKICVPASHSYHITIGKRIIGEFCLLFTGDVVSLWSFHIMESERGKGYGKIVLQTLIDALIYQQRTKLVLYVKSENTGAIRLYESFNFKNVPQADSTSLYYELALRHIKLGKLPHFLGKSKLNISI